MALNGNTPYDLIEKLKGTDFQHFSTHFVLPEKQVMDAARLVRKKSRPTMRSYRAIVSADTGGTPNQESESEDET